MCCFVCIRISRQLKELTVCLFRSRYVSPSIDFSSSEHMSLNVRLYFSPPNLVNMVFFSFKYCLVNIPPKLIVLHCLNNTICCYINITPAYRRSRVYMKPTNYTLVVERTQHVIKSFGCTFKHNPNILSSARLYN